MLHWCGCASRTRGLFLVEVNHPSMEQMILDFVTIASTGNATDFGDLSSGSWVSWMC